MAISLTVIVANEPDVTPPPPDPDPPPGTPPATTAFIDHAATLAQRNAMVAAHTVGTGDPGFTGITDTTGFTTYTATNAEELRTALAASASTATTKKLITCNWNGVSTFAGSSIINGPGTTALASYVNGAKDIGYDMIPHATKVVAGSGFNPIVGKAGGGASSESLNLPGWGYIHFEGIGFSGNVLILRTSTRPMLPVAAFKSCTFENLLYVRDCRTAHIDTCTFDGLLAGVRFGAQYTRFWGNETKNKNKDGDFATNVSYSQAYKATWTPHLWVAGNILHSLDEFGASPNHYDWLQYGVGADDVIGSLNMLVEFNIANNNAPATQGFFGDVSGINYETNICAHNNIITVNAYYGMVGKDPLGTGEIRFYRNHVLRASAKSILNDTTARIAIIECGGVDGVQTAPTTAIYDVRENYANTFSIESGMAANTTVANNQAISNNAGANYVADVFTGNGTWALDASGRTIYNDPGFGLSKAAAKTAIRNFWMPIGGYRVAGFGVVDPNTWPAPGAAW